MMKFTIHGNQENENGNPLPKHRKTARQQHTPAAVRYHEYLDYVRAAFIDQVVEGKQKFDMQHFSFVGRKPLATGDRKCHMRIFITWGDRTHGDPENIFGAIADAIFEQDKYLSGEFDFDPIIREAGRVDVEITIGEDRCGLHPGKRKPVAK